jgi:hypothetical protein
VKAGRRGILKAGAAAVGVALLPLRAAEAGGAVGALDTLRAGYLGRVRAFAERIRPEAAEALAGINGEEADEMCDVARWLDEACRDALVPTEEDARIAFAVSAHWMDDNGISLYEDVRVAVADCIVVRDVADALETLGLPQFARFHAPFADAA